MTNFHSFLRGLLPLLVLLSATPLRAQPASDDTGDDVEIDVEVDAEPAAPAAPAAAPAPSKATASTDAASTSESIAEASAKLEIPVARDPAGATQLPRSLLAEGSNYTRPLRLGLAWWGFVQADYYTTQASENQLDPDGEPLNDDQFGIRRARLRIDSGWQYAFATLELDVGTFGGANVRVRRAEASLLYRADVPDDITPPFVLTAGIIDVTFGAEIGESQRDRLFVERSIGSIALFPSLADGGVKLWGVYRFFNYALALVNGESVSGSFIPKDHDSHKDLVGRLGVKAKPSDAITITGGVSFYVGKGFHPGTQATKDTLSWFDFDNNGVVGDGEIQGVTGSTALPSKDYERWALGMDAGASFRHPIGVTVVTAEGFYASNMDRGVLPHDPIVSGVSTRQLGLTASLIQQLTEWARWAFASRITTRTAARSSNAQASST